MLAVADPLADHDLGIEDLVRLVTPFAGGCGRVTGSGSGVRLAKVRSIAKGEAGTVVVSRNHEALRVVVEPPTISRLHVHDNSADV